jgi:hypothetical protein
MIKNSIYTARIRFQMGSVNNRIQVLSLKYQTFNSAGTWLLLSCLLLDVRRIVRWGDHCVGGVSGRGGGGSERLLRHSRAHSLQAAQLSLQFSLLTLQLCHLQASNIFAASIG